MARYFKCNDGSIYKKRDRVNDYLKCTPWKEGEDRRKSWDDLVKLEAKELPTHKATEEINNIWRATTWKWKHGNKKYETRGFCAEREWKSVESELSSGKKRQYKWLQYQDVMKLCKPHEFTTYHRWTDRDGNIQVTKWVHRYFLVCYQGRIRWVTVDQYFPQCELYEFEDINKEPRTMVGWTNINCVRPIYCVTDKEYI